MLVCPADGVAFARSQDDGMILCEDPTGRNFGRQDDAAGQGSCAIPDGITDPSVQSRWVGSRSAIGHEVPGGTGGHAGMLHLLGGRMSSTVYWRGWGPTG